MIWWQRITFATFTVTAEIPADLFCLLYLGCMTVYWFHRKIENGEELDGIDVCFGFMTIPICVVLYQHGFAGTALSWLYHNVPAWPFTMTSDILVTLLGLFYIVCTLHLCYSTNRNGEQFDGHDLCFVSMSIPVGIFLYQYGVFWNSVKLVAPMLVNVSGYDFREICRLVLCSVCCICSCNVFFLCYVT